MRPTKSEVPAPIAARADSQFGWVGRKKARNTSGIDQAAIA
jgi:hypothetical protein